MRQFINLKNNVMKTLINKKTGLGSLLLVSCLTLFSFTGQRGGDYFEIYLNQKLILQQALHLDKSVRTISLTAANYNDELSIKFSHCGAVGKGRSITLKDEQDHILKQWKFADATGSQVTMTCKVKDILDVQKSSQQVAIKLYYSSNELPNGRVLASIAKGNTDYVIKHGSKD
jgi:hypothetical protein